MHIYKAELVGAICFTHRPVNVKIRQGGQNMLPHEEPKEFLVAGIAGDLLWLG